MKTNVRDTSLLAYYDIKDNNAMSNMQEQVFRVILFSDEPPTNKEISTLLDIPINSITPRVNELRNMPIHFRGINYRVVTAGRRYCTIKPFRLSYTWRAEEV